MTRKFEFVVGITGASGAQYGIRTIQELYRQGAVIHLLLTSAAWQVIREEVGWDITAWDYGELLRQLNVGDDRVIYYRDNDYRAPIASGSYRTDGMVVIPCSMGTLSALAHGASDNLLERAADTMIKEGRPLVIVPRETPLHQIHLKNMLTLAEAGVKILPAMPGFYHKPVSIDDLVNFVVGKTLDALHVDHQLFKRWGSAD